MNQDFLRVKLNEHMSRIIIATRSGDSVRERRAIRDMLIFGRLNARESVNDFSDAVKVLCGFRRAVAKAKGKGVTSPLFDARARQLEQERDKARERMVKSGEAVSGLLDLWQLSGATLEELCNLCNRDYAQVLKEIKNDNVDMDFSQLVFIYNLDFKSDLGWLDFAVDAPFTHTIKEYMLDIMLNTKEGQVASHEALEACFPGLLEKAMTISVGDDGFPHFFDKDGSDMGLVDGEG